MPETLRTFIALPLPDPIVVQLDKIERDLRRLDEARAVRWVAPEKIHLTLFFLGDVLTERIPHIKEALSVVARHFKPVTFEVVGWGAFPNPRRPRVLWVGVTPGENLRLLHATVNEAMESLGFKPDRRRFSPHLTLGRMQRRASRADQEPIHEALDSYQVGRLGSVEAREMILFRSDLKTTGAEYTPLATFTL